MRVLFGTRDLSYQSTPNWARNALNVARALAEVGCTVWSLTPKYDFSLRPWEKHIHFISELSDLEGQSKNFEIVQGIGLSSSKTVIKLANRFSAKPFQWSYNDISLDFRDFFYMLAHEWPMVKKSKERFAFCLKGLAPTKVKRYVIRKFHISNLIVPTKHLANQLISCGINSTNIFVVPIGVDSRLFSPLSPDKFTLMKSKIGVKKRSVFFFGGFTPLRGIKMVIKAFGIVKKQIKDAQLVLAVWGSPFLFKDCLNIGYKRDIYNYIGLFDVVCLPFKSTYAMTSIPRTLLEAMSAGRPVVSTNIRPIQEVISSYKEGILVDYNEQSIAKAVIELLEDISLREKLGENARKKIEKKYDEREVAKNWINLYVNS